MHQQAAVGINHPQSSTQRANQQTVVAQRLQAFDHEIVLAERFIDLGGPRRNSILRWAQVAEARAGVQRQGWRWGGAGQGRLAEVA
ncbi:MAG: hypothetical protein ACK5TT_00400, partial [Lysobacteraceae bacterium]